MITLTVILSFVAGITCRSWTPTVSNSAASHAQVRFAIENKYDNTGPGANKPEYAYKTYTTLDEALVAFSNDPDTQLPELEKAKALHKLVYKKFTPVQRYQPKTVDEYTGYQPQLNQNQNIPIDQYDGYKPNNIVQLDNFDKDFRHWKSYDQVTNLFPKKSVGNASYYSYTPRKVVNIKQRNPNEGHKYSYGFQELQPQDFETHEIDNAEGWDQTEFDSHPRYSFSYGVHDKGTGDSKSAHETRDGGTVRGYYTFLDSDGKQRTVHYTADDKLGFRANVQRTLTNTQ